MLAAEGLVTMGRVMHDWTKIKASAGKDTFRGEACLSEHLIRAEAHVKALEEASEEEVTPRIQKAKERAAREQKKRLARALDELEKIKAKKSLPCAGERHRSRMSLHEPVGWRVCSEL